MDSVLKHHFFTKLGSAFRSASPLHAKYDPTARDEIFRDFCEDQTFADIDRWLLVTSFRLDGIVEDGEEAQTFFPSGRWRPALLTNMPRLHGVVDTDLELHHALMASTAAPVYFPIHKGYTDGGVFANNPSLCAMTKVLSHLPGLSHRDGEHRDISQCSLSHRDISVLSIGTCVQSAHHRQSLHLPPSDF